MKNTVIGPKNDGINLVKMPVPNSFMKKVMQNEMHKNGNKP